MPVSKRRSLFVPVLAIAAAMLMPLTHVAQGQSSETDARLPGGSGMYPAIFEQVEALPEHVVYRPSDLFTVEEGELGIYVYGNGGCSRDGTSSMHHLLEIASQGYLAIALGIIPGPDNESDVSSQSRPGELVAETPAEAFKQAIDWAVGEGNNPESPFHGRIATDKIAVSGWSCGGLQALLAATDARVKTSVIMYSGIFNDNRNPIRGLEVDKSLLDRLHGSILYVLGGPDDIAYPNGMDDYRRITDRPAAVVNIPVGHGGTFQEPNGGLAAQVVTAWLDWQLKGKTEAAGFFAGGDCGYCHDPRLSIERKHIE